ncbi:MAG: hypothetical protein WDZ90_03115 [Candidatus Paceibacterota bacterium]
MAENIWEENKGENNKRGDEKRRYFDKKTISSFLVGLAVGILAVVLWMVAGPQEANAPIEEADNTQIDSGTAGSQGNAGATNPSPIGAQFNSNSNEGQAAGNVIVVADQRAGALVLVDRVSLSTSGWVAIHEDNAGTLGNILGAARFSEGEHAGSVTLLRETKANREYHAVLYVDDGDEVFDFREDTLLEAQPGVPLVTTFETF